jgi:hypothetical protein
VRTQERRRRLRGRRLRTLRRCGRYPQPSAPKPCRRSCTSTARRCRTRRSRSRRILFVEVVFNLLPPIRHMSAKPEAGQRTETLPVESIVFVVGISCCRCYCKTMRVKVYAKGVCCASVVYNARPLAGLRA